MADGQGHLPASASLRGLAKILADVVEEGLWLLDAEGRTLFMSPRLAELLQVEPGKAGGYQLKDFLPAGEHRSTFIPATAGGSPFPATLRARDGRLLPVEIRSREVPAQIPRPPAVLVAVRDLTSERAQTEHRERLEAYSRALFDESPQPMWIQDSQTRGFLAVNNAALALYEWSREEFLSLRRSDLEVSETKDATERPPPDLKPGVKRDRVRQHRRRGGSPVRVELATHAVEFGGRPAELVVVRDVTDHWKTERALLAVAASTVAATGKEYFQRIARYLASEFDVRHAFLAELLPGSQTRVRTLAAWSGGDFAPDFEYDLVGTPCEHVVGGEVCFFPAEIQRLFPEDHLLVEMQAEAYAGTPVFSTKGDTLGLLAIIHDRPLEESSHIPLLLTVFAERAGAEIERQRIEDALRKSESMKSALLDALPDPIFRISRDGTCVDFHAPENRAPPPASDGVRKHQFAELLPPAVAALCKGHLESVFQTGCPRTFACEFPIHGETRNWEIRLVPREEKEVLGLFRDVTEYRRLEDRIRHTQKLESLGVLAGGIAHDFNNLLTGVLGFAEMALAHVPEDSPIHEHLRNIELAAQRGAELTRQMLVYSGKSRCQMESLDLNALVDEVLRLLRTMISSNASVELRFAEGLPPIRADAAQVRQVVMNLLTNAADALRPRGGIITVTTGLRSPGPDAFLPPPAGLEDSEAPPVFLQITDNGCGMDADTMERIFEPFFTTKFAGRGLGLAAVLGIMRTHRGALEVESQPRQGTAFSLYFPRAARSPKEVRIPPIRPRGRRPAERVSTATILVVDDEESVRTLVSKVLEQEGHRVVTAEDGQEAVERFRQMPGEVDLVLLDVTMPRLGGSGALLALRQIRRDVGVVLMSGYSQEEAVARFPARKLAGFLQKPFGPSELLKRVDRALYRQRRQREAGA